MSSFASIGGATEDCDPLADLGGEMTAMEITTQILVVLAIVVAVFMIVVLWRLNQVLLDVKDTTAIAKKRAKDFDSWLSQAEATVSDFATAFKNFLGTFEQLKKIKNKMSSFWEEEPAIAETPKKAESKKEE